MSTYLKSNPTAKYEAEHIGIGMAMFYEYSNIEKQIMYVGHDNSGSLHVKNLELGKVNGTEIIDRLYSLLVKAHILPHIIEERYVDRDPKKPLSEITLKFETRVDQQKVLGSLPGEVVSEQGLTKDRKYFYIHLKPNFLKDQ